MEKLVRLCESFKAKIQGELNEILIDPNEFKASEDLTEAGKYISTITHSSDIDNLNRLTTLMPEDLTRLDLLMSELNASDPKMLIQQKENLKKRVQGIIERLQSVEKLATPEVLDGYSELFSSYVAAENALAIVIRDTFNDSLLEGVGSESWKLLFQAAKNYSESFAYPRLVFPVIAEDSKCLLCHQDLNPMARRRLEKFNSFLQNDIQKKRDEFKNKLDSGILFYSTNVLSDMDLDEATKTEVSEYSAELPSITALFITEIREFFQKLSTAKSKEDVLALGAMPKSPLVSYGLVLDTISEGIIRLNTIATDIGRVGLKAELSELLGRKNLLSLKPRIIKRIEDLRKIEKLRACINDLNTRNISMKSTVLIEKAVASGLKNKLTEEFKKLRIDNIRIDLTSGTERGSPYFRFVIEENGVRKDYTISQILSQGEQRAISLAIFFSEIASLPSISCAVFDDPVSSLDHERKELVAERIAEEGKLKQIIVFTHDLSFLSDVQDKAIHYSTTVETKTIIKHSGRTGICEDGLPWDGMPVIKRVKWLKGVKLPIIRKILENGTTEEKLLYISDFYEKLRRTWERTVEDNLLNGVVLRFGSGVHTQKLNAVQVTDEDHKTVYQSMSRCSSFVHDRARNCGAIAIPSFSDLEKDLNDLENFQSSLEARKAELARKRKNEVGA